MKKLIAVAALMTACQMPAHALSVSFIQPDGVVGPSDDIAVMIRVTADADFAFDGNDFDGGFGLDPALIPLEGLFFGDAGPMLVSFDSFTSVFTNIGYVCSGSFSDGGESVCPPGSEYDFSFNTTGADAFSGQDTFTLAAGESQDFLFGTFTPLDGAAAPGDYNFFGANVSVLFVGLGTDEFGNAVNVFASVTLATTCGSGDTSCDFSRTVVPVPGAVWLFGSALGCLVGARRRKRQS